MTTQTNELHTDILIRAIVKDATGYMETIDKEDMPCNEQHKRCLGIIARAFDAQAECDEALEAGDVARLGTLMNAAHESARDDYEISTPEIDALVDACLEAGAVGARITGAGWGGCVVALVASEQVEAFVSQVSLAYRAATGLQAESFVCRSARGAGLMFSTNL